jgi:alpha-amylase/alpha-mannosidase (GH57 family)
MKYVCIHGHYYQPPRENAWLEFVEYQDSAHPYHDWNERVNAEAYAPNAASRILDEDGMITDIVNNYAKISFNFGPTLLSWMEQQDPTTYKSILKADKVSQKYFSGHGNAIAQSHSHVIMPLANERDKETQILWGIKDFENRFERKPEGMWLSETAVDTDTLEVMASYGLKFTILAPRQAKAFRKIEDENWTPLGHAEVDPRRPYLCKLPSGKTMALFFYDGQVAQDVAFNNLLASGSRFANRILGALDGNTEPQLSHIATDGESYGHHHRFGDMALAGCLNHIEKNSTAKLTNYGEYLEKFPPQYEVEIHESSSWSCVHGVERWRSNCGCHTGGQAGWTQTWREPLRNALDWLRDNLIEIYVREAGYLLKDPWDARNDFINVITNRSDESVDAFLAKHALHANYTKENKVQILRLLEMQRNAMYMFTSCGWFFTEVSGLETTQILQYACRAIYYARQVGNIDFEKEFIERLRLAKSNMPEHQNGAVIYKKFVLPVEVGLDRTGMHYAILSLFEKFPDTLNIFNNYSATSELYERKKAGRQKLAIGRTTIKSRITHSEKHFSFAVIYLGQQNIIGHISLDMKRDTFDVMRSEIQPAFKASNLSKVLTTMQKYFGEQLYSMDDLFKDEKIKILNQILETSLVPMEVSLRGIYNDNYHLLNAFLKDNLPIRNEHQGIIQYILNNDLHNFFNQELLHVRQLKKIVAEFKRWGATIQDKKGFQLIVNENVVKALHRLESDLQSIERIEELNKIFDLLQELDLEQDVWQSQNLYFSMAKNRKAMGQMVYNQDWVNTFVQLGKHLNVKINFQDILAKV